jgi:hypothetical protein
LGGRPHSPTPRRQGGWTEFGASGAACGSPQAEFEIPYGHLGQNAGYALIANRYAAEFGYDPVATAKIAVDQRTSACANPAAVFHGQPITVDDVLASKLVADPLHLLEIVMPLRRGRGDRRHNSGASASVDAPARTCRGLRGTLQPQVTGIRP